MMASFTSTCFFFIVLLVGNISLRSLESSLPHQPDQLPPTLHGRFEQKYLPKEPGKMDQTDPTVKQLDKSEFRVSSSFPTPQSTSFPILTTIHPDHISNEEVVHSGIYDIPSWMAVILTIVYLAVSLCAVLGNWMVLWIVIRSSIMRNVTNLFIANLAVADIIIGAFAIPFNFQAALLQKWVLPFFMCSFCPTVQTISLNVSIFTLVAVSIDRHRAVTQPLKPRLSKRTAIMIIVFIWIFSIFLAIPTMIAFKIIYYPVSYTTDNGGNIIEVEPICEPSGIDEGLMKKYNHLLVILQYFIPFIIIAYTYTGMAIVLSSSSGISDDARNDSGRVNQSKRRVMKMLLIVICIFAICWLPYQLYNILREIYPAINTYRYINLIWFACHLFAMSNSCYNPFIYAIYGEKFSMEFRERFHLCCFWSSRCNPTRVRGTVMTSRKVNFHGSSPNSDGTLSKSDRSTMHPRREPDTESFANDTTQYMSTQFMELDGDIPSHSSLNHSPNIT